MRLQRLTSLERDKIIEEYAEVLQLIAPLPGDPRPTSARCSKIIVAELREVQRAVRRRAPHRDRRRDRRDLASRTLIAEEDMVVTISHDGLHQAEPGRRVPRPAPRRHGQDRRDDQGRGLRRAPLRRLDPRLHPVLHHRRQGLLAQGARDPAGRPRRARQGDRQPAQPAAGREGLRLPAGARVRATAATCSSRPARAW